MLQEENFWKGKRVFLTGHTGFKGSWLALWLTDLGATVRGFALSPPSSPSLFEAAKIDSLAEDIRGDIRDAKKVESVMMEFSPEIVFHLAAQPLVRSSYSDPIGTYETNVLGTAHVLNAVRRSPSVRAVVCVTTDKCYENKEWVWGYRESDPLGGYDPYSSSKACAEIVSAAFRQSYFPVDRFLDHCVGIATARAGNVIGGGDWSLDRLIPDLIRGFSSGKPATIRNPHAIRPWQHVLEPLHGYLLLAEALAGREGAKYSASFNFGPSDDDAREVGWIATHLAKAWGEEAQWVLDEDLGVHEAQYLKLDASRARRELSWSPRLALPEALIWLVDWYRAYFADQDMERITRQQIRDYCGLLRTT